MMFDESTKIKRTVFNISAPQKIPQPSVFAQTMMGALETSDVDLVSKVSTLFSSSGYDFDMKVFEERERRRKERVDTQRRKKETERRQRMINRRT